jgi:putative endonuclease
MVERQLPKLHTGVRFPSPAPAFASSAAESERWSVRRSLARRRTLTHASSYGWQASLRTHYVYLLRSESRPKQQYVGLTRDLRQRLADHNKGRSPHTSKFCPWLLVAYFAFSTEGTAIAFEKYLKSGSGRAFIKRHFNLAGGRNRFPSMSLLENGRSGFHPISRARSPTAVVQK